MYFNVHGCEKNICILFNWRKKQFLCFSDSEKFISMLFMAVKRKLVYFSTEGKNNFFAFQIVKNLFQCISDCEKFISMLFRQWKIYFNAFHGCEKKICILFRAWKMKISLSWALATLPPCHPFTLSHEMTLAIMSWD